MVYVRHRKEGIEKGMKEKGKLRSRYSRQTKE